MATNTILSNIFLSLALFCLSFFLSWQFNATSNFFYANWYEVLEIDKTIDKYGPSNKYKSGFEELNKAEHVRLFKGIVQAIQHKVESLKQLEYKNKNSSSSEKLLTDAEVIHLQDVANLVSRFKYLAYFGLLVGVMLLSFMCMKKISMVKIKYHLLGGCGFLALLVILIIIIGPTKVFYLGHELIFPNNHQWFFYYEESLMSTMMKAPVLFGPIALQLLLGTVVLWFASLCVARYLLLKSTAELVR